MKKYIRTALILCLSTITLSLQAQLILKSGSLKSRPNDTEILVNRNSPEQRQLITDGNGELCALIKITINNMTEADKRAFLESKNRETDRATFITKVETEHTNELWIFLTPGCNYMILKHPDYGSCRFGFGNMGFHLQSGKVYEAVMEGDREIFLSKMRLAQQEDAGGQYLVLTVYPHDAQVFIDDNYEPLSPDGSLSKRLKYGVHTYRIEAPMYNPQNDRFEITSERKRINVSLTPNFGAIHVSTTPEQGGKVYIDGEYVGIAPCTSEKLKVGSHELRVLLDMYRPQTQQVTLASGDTAKVDLRMSPNFALLELSSADAQAALFIENEQVAVGAWQGRLTPGIYMLEARKPGHRSTQQSIEIVAGKDQSLQLLAPEPIYGSIEVNTQPIDVMVSIDGEEKGYAPDIFKNILVGSHRLQLSKTGYISNSLNVEVEEGKITPLNLSLLKNDQPEENVPTSASTSPAQDDLSTKKVNVSDFYLKANFAFMPLSYGLSFGCLNTWGWYVNTRLNADFSRAVASAGVIKQISDPLYFYAGLGGGITSFIYQHRRVEGTQTLDFDLALGAMCRFNRLLFSVGMNHALNKGFETEVGVGWVF